MIRNLLAGNCQQPPRGCDCASQTGKVCSASIQPACCRLIACCLYVSVRLDLPYRFVFRRIANHAGTHVGCRLWTREACPSFFASRAAVPHPALRFAQSTFHSRMTDAACNLAPVWMVRTICQHRPYCLSAQCLHCMSYWKVFSPRAGISDILGR